jgi:Xaa-Pro aminopeptidase
MARDASFEVARFRGRRQRLLDRLGDGLLLVPTAAETLRNGDVHHPFRPGSDFHYLTGFPEPDAMLVAWRTGRSSHRAELFVRPRDQEREIWDGRRFGTAGARRRFGVDAAHPMAELGKRLPGLLCPHRRLFHTLGRDPQLDRDLMAAFAALRHERRRQAPPAHPVIEDPGPALAAQRLIKDAAEIQSLQRAAAVTVAGHLAAMAAARPGAAEYEVQAALESEFRRLGSPRNGYAPIVASGQNACILHYRDNDRVMRSGDLLLLDAGAEVEGYTADITRTFPVSGTFTGPQAAVYRIVLRAQAAGIRAVRPGAAWNAPHRACVRALTRGLVELGVLRGPVDRLVRKQAYKPYYMHGTSHWLGRDVHDAGAYEDEQGRPVRMRAGMVLTVEPGLYFAARASKVPRELRGIGVRIEDDVLVTRTGRRVLTEAAPRTIAELEAACARRPG